MAKQANITTIKDLYDCKIACHERVLRNDEAICKEK